MHKTLSLGVKDVYARITISEVNDSIEMAVVI